MVFLVEMVLKIISLGLLSTTGAYLKSGWNCLDGFCVSASLIAILGTSSPAFRVLRMLRVLRPLRLLSKSGGMRIIIDTLFCTMLQIGPVLIVYILFLTIFGILGVQLFKGKMVTLQM